MTRDEMQELKRLAQAAPSPDELNFDIRGPTQQSVKAAWSFMRSASPAVVLALIARIEELEARNG